MKLITFQPSNEKEACFGIALHKKAISFAAINHAMHGTVSIPPELTNSSEYVANFPESESTAQKLFAFAHENAQLFEDSPQLDSVTLLPPITQPPALLDFGLSPRHLFQSARTLITQEYGRIAWLLVRPAIRRKLKKMTNSAVLPYYKGNHYAIIGHDATMGWPAYSSYLDIEPELAFVFGTPERPILGYMIFNDVSARDVQLPEMLGTGPARSKDFTCGNGFGPYLVTADEVADPLALNVTVQVGSRYVFSGTTAEYSHHPRAVAEFIQTITTPTPGAIIGMGTVPDCTGLDSGRWIYPGDVVDISIEKLGTLRQHTPQPVIRSTKQRWAIRPELSGREK